MTDPILEMFSTNEKSIQPFRSPPNLYFETKTCLHKPAASDYSIFTDDDTQTENSWIVQIKYNIFFYLSLYFSANFLNKNDD